MRNTIVAGNADLASGAAHPDCDAANSAGFLFPLESEGFNLIGNTTGRGITGDPTGNVTNQDAVLGALLDDGGPTPTHALEAGSSAIDAGNPALPGSGGTRVPRPISAASRARSPSAGDATSVRTKPYPERTTPDAVSDGVRSRALGRARFASAAGWCAVPRIAAIQCEARNTLGICGIYWSCGCQEGGGRRWRCVPLCVSITVSDGSRQH